jgi:hypothetical protein
MTISPENSAAKVRRTRVVMLIVGLIIYSAFVYGSGMEAELHKAKTVNEARKLAAQDYRDAQRKLRLRIAAVELLEARRQVDVALTALDQRNFGTAQGHVSAAATLLGEAQQSGTNVPDMAEAATALKATNLTTATDFAGQRTALTGIAAKMDAALDPYSPSFIDMSLKDDAAHPIKNPTMNDVPVLPGNDIIRDR